MSEDLKPRSGWPEGMLQDDSRALSDWLSAQPDAMQHAREAAQRIALDRVADKALARRFTGEPLTGFGGDDFPFDDGDDAFDRDKSSELARVDEDQQTAMRRLCQ